MAPANPGTGAPRGVSGGMQELLDGSLRDRLAKHIRSTGGNYTDH